MMLGSCTLTLEHFLLFLELRCHFLVGLTDQLFSDHCLTLFTGHLDHVSHDTGVCKHADVFRLDEVDTAGGFLAVLGTVDDFRCSLCGC